MVDRQQYPEHTYIRRRGRMTQAQAKAFATLAPEYSIKPEQIQAYAGKHPVGIEIGFGMGHALLAWAASAPESRLCGIELYQPGIGALTAGLHRQQLDNVRVLERPAQQVLTVLEDRSVSEIRIFFPDPWPKKRHHKRRLIQPAFVADVARVLMDRGIFRLATDWQPYAQWIRHCFEQEPGLLVERDNIRDAGSVIGAVEEDARPTTKFERRGVSLGHDIHDLVCSRLIRTNSSKASLL